MKIGAIIICRYNSSRLPGKILKEINGKTILSYIIERLKCVENLDDIIVATSDQKSDEPIVDYCIAEGIKFYRGSLLNVAKRFLDCSKAFNFDYSIRINGDNLFLDHSMISKMINKINENDFDMISNVKDRTFPKGISVEIINIEFYKKMFSKLNTPYLQEHVTIYFYENLKSGNFCHYINTTYPAAGGSQLSIDTEKDFNIATKIIDSFNDHHSEYGFEEIYKRMIRFQRLQ